MSLFDRISDDIKKAMLARDKEALEALRGVKKEFLEAKTAKGAQGELTDDAALKILAKMIKQRRESAQIYTEQNRPELAEAELAQARVIETYMPKQLTADELTSRLTEIITRLGAKGPQDMGKVMGTASKELAGVAEGRAISATVKQLLQQQ
ncbi:MAG: GatB/YqeY domain-containing protein [Muribaculaceae bacterium]|nr:GatB/YqeY domain-containing protein [Muribaculaceae bacterium]